MRAHRQHGVTLMELLIAITLLSLLVAGVLPLLAALFALTFADETSPEIHLSDGGHFENLALYELVRRHCRYIIVSDCGEDPAVAFEDFGNAARRIREDFGVDIDVDLGALRPDPDRRSRQHVVVGRYLGGVDEAQVILVAGVEAFTEDAPGGQGVAGQPEQPGQVPGQLGLRLVEAQAQVRDADGHRAGRGLSPSL